MVDGAQLPIVDLPSHFDSLLDKRAERWNDQAALAHLYTDGAVVAAVWGLRQGCFGDAIWSPAPLLGICPAIDATCDEFIGR